MDISIEQTEQTQSNPRCNIAYQDTGTQVLAWVPNCLTPLWNLTYDNLT